MLCCGQGDQHNQKKVEVFHIEEELRTSSTPLISCSSDMQYNTEVKRQRLGPTLFASKTTSLMLVKFAD